MFHASCSDSDDDERYLWEVEGGVEGGEGEGLGVAVICEMGPNNQRVVS